MALRIGGPTKSPALPPELPTEEAPLPPEEAPPQFNMSIKKVDPAMVWYKTSDQGPFICSNCDYFEDEDGSCTLVDGPIDPEGVCNLYTPVAGGAEVPQEPPMDELTEPAEPLPPEGPPV